jgi:response regulator RpfG family c-di-GMP phosphodiesterase
MKAILIDDNASILFMMGRLLQNVGLQDVSTFRDPLLALDAVAATQFDIVVVDYMMPGIDGLEFIRRVRAMPSYADVPIVMVTTADEKAVCYAALEAGATDFLHKPVDMAEAKARIRNLSAMREMQNKLRDRAAWLADEVRKATAEMAALEEEIILRLSRATEYRDSDTGAHVVRMARTCREIAEELSLDDVSCRDIYLAAPMHDIGKIGVPDAILMKTGPLTPEERTMMESHVRIGEAILSGSDSRLIRLAAEIAASHHERWNGSGYPGGLAGETIPLAGRIAAVADVFDALISERPYKPAWTFEKAAAFIRENAGTLFDPEVVGAFDARLFRIARIATEVPDPPVQVA